MGSIVNAVSNSFLVKKARGWNRIYYFFDIHGTIIRPNYKVNDVPTEFYPHAIETLQFLSNREDICMILYTCSHPHEIEQYQRMFKEHNINFEYVNENPEVVTKPNEYGCYDKKPYMNVLFEDKAGFDGDTDWLLVLQYLKVVYGTN